LDFPFSNLLDGTKKLATKIYNSTGELFTPTNPGTVQVSGSNFEQTLNTTLPVKAVLQGLSDGTNIQAFKGNFYGSLLASAVRTASIDSPIITNNNARGVLIGINVTAVSGTGGLKIVVYGMRGGNPIRLNVDHTAITTPGYYGIEIYPGASLTTYPPTGMIQRVAGVISDKFSVTVYHIDASSYTYSLSYSLLV